MPDIIPGRTAGQRQASAILVKFNRQVDDVRADKNLTPAGKTARIAQLYLDARAAITPLKTSETAAPIARKSELQAKLFGMPKSADASTVIAYRDAQDRASRLTSMKDATKLADAAVSSGDSQLERAIIAQAFTEGWGAILKYVATDADYQARNPEVASGVAELLAIHEAANGPYASAGQFAASMAYSLPKPSELDGLNNDTAIEQAAAGADWNEKPEPANAWLDPHVNPFHA